MFDEAHHKLGLDEVAAIVENVNKQIDGSVFDPLETTILAADISFYPNCRFLDICDHATNPPLQRSAVQKGNSDDYTLLDWTYKTIYGLNQRVPINLNERNVLDYVRFFFRYVKGRHGRFIICESSENVPWKDEPPQEVKRSLNKIVEPLKIVDKRKDGILQIKGSMVLKDAAFKVDIFVEPNGRITMADHEILIEDLPVVDSVMGQ